MWIKFCNNKIGQVKSEKGFTLLELIMVTVITGILSSTLILPFASNIKNGTQPEIYNTAAYIAVGELEKKKSDTFAALSSSIGTTNTTVTKEGRVYTKVVVTGFVTHSAGSFNNSATPTELIRITTTVSTPGITSLTMSEVLTDDF